LRKILLALIVLTIWSCDNRAIVHEQEVVFEDNAWDYGEKLDIEFSIADTTQTYDLVLEIEHDPEYPYQNFYTHFTTIYPEGKKVKDVVSMELANRMGQWNGTCKRNSCVAEILLRGNTLFKSTDIHKISIEQYSREARLEGIDKVRFLLVQK